MVTNPETDAYPWHTITVDLDALRATLRGMESAHVGYRLGAKARSLDDAPGTDPAIDCSGFVRYAIYQSTQRQAGGRVVLPDGSVTQHEACRALFKPSDPGDVGNRDGVLRIAFLEPLYAPDGSLKEPGHVVLILDGSTLESHGHRGPDSRAWGSQGWMARMSAYVLQLAPGA